MWLNILSHLVQGGLKIFLQYRGLTAGRQIGIQAARAYVESIRAARILVAVIVGLCFLVAVNVFALGLLTHAIYISTHTSLYMEQSAWMIGEYIASAFVFALDLLIFSVVLSDQAWMRLFKVPELIERVVIEPEAQRKRQQEQESLTRSKKVA